MIARRLQSERADDQYCLVLSIEVQLANDRNLWWAKLKLRGLCLNGLHYQRAGIYPIVRWFDKGLLFYCSSWKLHYWRVDQWASCSGWSSLSDSVPYLVCFCLPFFLQFGYHVEVPAPPWSRAGGFFQHWLLIEYSVCLSYTWLLEESKHLLNAHVYLSLLYGMKPKWSAFSHVYWRAWLSEHSKWLQGLLMHLRHPWKLHYNPAKLLPWFFPELLSYT